jgi:hypothetical protein
VLLYPRLLKSDERRLVSKLASISIAEAREASSTEHPDATFAATGGHRVTKCMLEELQANMRELARQCGYPEQPDEQQRRRFDAASGQLLYEKMQISAAEAAHPGIWIFMACVLLPDIVRWRFPGGTNSKTPDERFLWKSRGVRNTFGRVWWRAHILYQENVENPCELLYLLGEDELVQIMERPNIAGSPVLAKQICRSFIDASSAESGISRSDLLRDTMKRLRRLLAMTSFDALDKEVLRELIDSIFAESIVALKQLREHRKIDPTGAARTA